MNTLVTLNLLNLIIPLVLLLLGRILKKHPVSDRNSSNGYNTRASRKSQERWDYAQRIAPAVLLSQGWLSLAVLSLLSALAVFFHIPTVVSICVGTVIGFLFLLSVFVKVDRRINQKFPD